MKRKKLSNTPSFHMPYAKNPTYGIGMSLEYPLRHTDDLHKSILEHAPTTS
jgi:hypothetical protein